MLVRAEIVRYFARALVPISHFSAILRANFPELGLSEDQLQRDIGVRKGHAQAERPIDAERAALYSLAVSVLTKGDDSPLHRALRAALQAADAEEKLALQLARSEIDLARRTRMWSQGILDAFKLENSDLGIDEHRTYRPGLSRGYRRREVPQRIVLIVNGKEVDEDLLIAVHAPIYHRTRLEAYLRTLRAQALGETDQAIREFAPDIRTSLTIWAEVFVWRDYDELLQPKAIRKVEGAYELYDTTRKSAALLARRDWASNRPLTPGELRWLALIGKGWDGFALPSVGP